jgi:hypothetical protein
MLHEWFSKPDLLQFSHKRQEVMIMVTIEQVTKLREYADISYEEARAALEETDGDVLEAIVNLERSGRIHAPAGGGSYSTNTGADHTQNDHGNAQNTNASQAKDSASFGELVGRFFRWCGRIIHKGNINSLEVVRHKEKLMSVPVSVLVLLLIFIFWITIPLMIVGLFFGYSYRFAGPDLGKDKVNQTMDSVAEAAENLKKDIKGDKTDGTNPDNRG